MKKEKGNTMNRKQTQNLNETIHKLDLAIERSRERLEQLKRRKLILTRGDK